MSRDVLSIEKRTTSKVRRHIFPLILIAYIFAFLDRINIGYASLQMNQELGLSATVFGLASSIFFIGYFVCEVPSNMIMEKVGARLWLSRIMITWGVVSAGMMFVSGPISLNVLRGLLGIAEAGFFPGLVLYISYWFREKEHGTAVSTLLIGAYIACIVSAPMAGAILQMHGFFGLAGWKWLFLLEGIPSIIIGIIFYLVLVDRPEQAKWLEPEEKEWLVQAIAKEKAAKETKAKHSFASVMTSPRVLVLAFVNFCFGFAFYGLSFFLPQIVKSLSAGSGIMMVTTLSSLPYIGIMLSLFMFVPRSDRTGERHWHVVIGALVASLGLLVTSYAQSPVVALAFLVVFGMGLGVFQPIFWACTTQLLEPKELVVGVPFINSLVALGGFFGPIMMGAVKDATGSYKIATLILTLCMFLAGLVLHMMYVNVKKKQKLAVSQ